MQPRFSIVVGLLAVALTAGERARADCAVPAPALVWSFPADGDVDVPVDARLFFVGDGFSVALDGVGRELAPLANALVVDPAALSPLAPNSDHEIVVTFDAVEDRPPPPAPVTILFRTGEGSAAAVDSPEVNGVEVVGQRDLSPLCRRVLNNGECFDTGQNTDVKAVVDDTPLAFLITPRRVDDEFGFGRTRFWPVADCGEPGVFVFDFEGSGTDALCLQVASVAADGSVSDVVERCPGGCGGCSGGSAGVSSVVVGLLLRRRRVR